MAKEVCEWYGSLSDASRDAKVNINPLKLLNDVTRNPVPDLVIWDLGWRPGKPDQPKKLEKELKAEEKGDPKDWGRRFF